MNELLMAGWLTKRADGALIPTQPPSTFKREPKS